MATYGRCVLTGVLTTAAYAVMVRALGMLNRPSDAALYAGIALLFALFSLLPLGLRSIWRKRT